jgi:plasmid replication initiation protein
LAVKVYIVFDVYNIGVNTSDMSKKITATQDNQLIEACYTLSLNEKRILLLGIGRIDSRDWPALDRPLRLSITAEEWSQFYPDATPWRAMKRAADTLLTRYLTLHPKVGITQKISWFDNVEYHEQEARMTIEFGRMMQVRLMGMIEEFTKIDLLAVNQLKSVYSIRLYELCNQFRSTGFRLIAVDDFRFAMDCVKKYPKIAMLKQRVITPSVSEINEKSDINISVTEVKRGRKITHFEFTFRLKKNGANEDRNEEQLDLLALENVKESDFIKKHTDRSWAE